METKQETKETVKDAVGAGTLASDDIVVSVLDVDENGATIKLWPDAAAVRDKLNALGQTLYGDDYSLRRYLCGKALYCAIAIGDTTRDAPCRRGIRSTRTPTSTRQTEALWPLLQSGALALGCSTCRPGASARSGCRSTRWRAVTARRSTIMCLAKS